MFVRPHFLMMALLFSKEGETQTPESERVKQTLCDAHLHILKELLPFSRIAAARLYEHGGGGGGGTVSKCN